MTDRAVMSNLYHALPTSNGRMTEPSFESIMDNYLPAEFRSHLEEGFYAQVARQAKLENLKNDAEFHKDPIKHIALFSDHGVVHVRDVALQVLEVLQKVNGILIPERNKEDLEFLKAFSLQLVYLHDIGMANFSAFGRFMHPEFAAQYVFSPEFDSVLELMWNKNAGNVPWTLMRLFKGLWQEEKLKLVYREMLTLSVAHSKSKVPIKVVNNPLELQLMMQNILSKPLQLLFFEQKIQRFENKLGSAKNPEKANVIRKKIAALEKKRRLYLNHNDARYQPFLSHYQNVEKEAFEWLSMEGEVFQRFLVQLQDCIRCIRTADALRQRGTVLRTSAGYEIFVDRKTANAIYALRNESNDELYLLEGKKSINAGEANLASSELDAAGNLRVSFHLGAFYKKRIVNKAARNAAITIDDIQADVIQSFQRGNGTADTLFAPPKVPFEGIRILVEATEDNPEFAGLVCQFLEGVNPAIAPRIKESFSLQGLDLEEVKRYLDGQVLTEVLSDPLFRAEVLHQLAKVGYSFSNSENIPGQADIRIIDLASGEQLIKGGSTSGFVYFPLSNGLRVYPLGGYKSMPATAWVPIGNTGVIRGSERNAHVFAEKSVQLICVPKDIYLNHWYRPVSARELVRNWM